MEADFGAADEELGDAFLGLSEAPAEGAAAPAEGETLDDLIDYYDVTDAAGDAAVAIEGTDAAAPVENNLEEVPDLAHGEEEMAPTRDFLGEHNNICRIGHKI